MTRSRRTLIGGLLAAGVLAAAGVTACSRASEPDPVPLDQVLTARAELPRLIRHPRTVAVLVHNQGTEPVQVRQVELISESFAPVEPAVMDVIIPPGAAKALPVIYGEGQCGGELAPAVGHTTARLVVVVAGQEQTVELPIPNPSDLAPRLHADCVAQVVTRALTAELQDWSTRPDGMLQTPLVLSRVAGDEPITLHRVQGSVLYRFTPLTELPVELPAGTDSVAVPFVVDPARCDGHAMADAKFPYQFRAYLTIGDTPVIPADITTDLDGRDALPVMWKALCSH